MPDAKPYESRVAMEAAAKVGVTLDGPGPWECEYTACLEATIDMLVGRMEEIAVDTDNGVAYDTVIAWRKK